MFPVCRRLKIGRWELPTWAVLCTAIPAAVALTIGGVVSPSWFPVLRPWLYAYYVACLVGGTGALLQNWWRARSNREATQLRIVAFGSVLSLLPFLLLTMLPRIVVGRDIVRPEISTLSIILLPASFAYAILRYQLMDLRLYIRRGVVYSTLVALITGAYALLLFAATLVVKNRTGVSSVVAVAIVSAVFAIGGDRLRRAIQGFIDRLFDRRSYDYRRQLLEFSQRMNGILDPDELADSTVELIAQTMGPSHVRLYLYDPSMRTYHLWTAAGISPGPDRQTLDARDPAVEAVQGRSEPVQHLDVPPTEDAVIVPLVNKGHAVALLTLGPKRVDLPYTSEDLSLLSTVANQLAIATENAQLYGRMRDLYLSGIRTLAATVDAKDSYTHGHSERVARYARAIAVELGLPQLEVETIELAGLLHDIGKIGVPDVVLQKPGRLDPEERALIMEHAALGAKILADNLSLMPLVPLVRHHHEWYDGSGYPDGLSGDEIPLGAAIIAVADTYDTMTTDRPYRKAPGREQARAEILRCSGTQFNPRVVAAFLRTLDRHDWPEQTPPRTTPSALPNRDLMAGRINAVDARAMHIVYKVARMIGGITDLRTFIADVTELLRREIGVGHLDIYLVDPETGDLYGQTRAPGAVTGARIPAGEGLIGWVTRYQRPARVADLQADVRSKGTVTSMRSALAVPLAIEGRTIGVISVESRRIGVFTENDEALLNIVAQQLAQAIEVAQLHDQLKRASMLDGLTGVANHRTLYERLETELERAQCADEPLSVIMLDVDGLKATNDTHGHVAGDATLRAIASILQRESRTQDTVARCGGDEFAIILPGMDADEATRFADRLGRAIAEGTYEAHGRTLPLPSVSLGVAAYPADGDRAVTLVNVADQRMYQDKSQRPAIARRLTLAG
ncbi:MAG: diguanylate cyclase [Sphaerobacter sp.]|nr:diguanylate cyclase [Sphaerobacter sp.]